MNLWLLSCEPGGWLEDAEGKRLLSKTKLEATLFFLTRRKCNFQRRLNIVYIVESASSQQNLKALNLSLFDALCDWTLAEGPLQMYKTNDYSIILLLTKFTATFSV